MGRRSASVTLPAALVGAIELQRLGRTAGSTFAERRAALPGDELVRRPMFTTNHAITIDAPPSAVWPWLVQMGWHRGGWYTARWVDSLLFPANMPAADTIVPELQHLRVGDTILDGPPESECFFVVSELEPARHMVLHSRSHLPPGLRDACGAWIDWSWVFELRSDDDRSTRLIVRSRARLGPWWLAAAYWLALIPADFVMSRQMLHGIKRRVEGEQLTIGSGRDAALTLRR